MSIIIIIIITVSASGIWTFPLCCYIGLVLRGFGIKANTLQKNDNVEMLSFLLNFIRIKDLLMKYLKYVIKF
jgi:hypothetical protein